MYARYCFLCLIYIIFGFVSPEVKIKFSDSRSQTWKSSLVLVHRRVLALSVLGKKNKSRGFERPRMAFCKERVVFSPSVLKMRKHLLRVLLYM